MAPASTLAMTAPPRLNPSAERPEPDQPPDGCGPSTTASHPNRSTRRDAAVPAVASGSAATSTGARPFQNPNCAAA